MNADDRRNIAGIGAELSGVAQYSARHAAETEAAIEYIAILVDEPTEDVARVVSHVTRTSGMTVHGALDMVKRYPDVWERWKAEAS